MSRRRRNLHSEPRIELIPLIDVMMFLLTFFLYAFVMTVRIEVLPMELQQFAAAEQAKPVPAVTISIDLNDRIFVNRHETDLDHVLDRVNEAKAADPRTIVYLALADGMAGTDRAPTLTALWDRLKDAGLTINFVGRPKDPVPVHAGP